MVGIEKRQFAILVVGWAHDLREITFTVDAHEKMLALTRFSNGMLTARWIPTYVASLVFVLPFVVVVVVVVAVGLAFFTVRKFFSTIVVGSPKP